MSRSVVVLVFTAAVSLTVASIASSCGESSRRAIGAGTFPGRTCHGPVEIRSAVDLGILAGCTEIDGDLSIQGTTLVTLAGFERLTSVRYLVVSDNPGLTSLEGLSGLRSAEGITINGNPVLKSLAGLDGVRSLEGLVVTGNGISSLAGLDNLVVTGDLVVSGNPALTSLSGALRLTSVENLDIEKNPRLTGLGELGGIEIGGSSWTDFTGATARVAAR